MQKSAMWGLITLGGGIGGMVPLWLGASYFSVWGIVGSTVGALVGLYAFKQLDV